MENLLKEKVPLVVDTREKIPLFVDGDKDFDIISRKLDTGDYTILGLESKFVVERKRDLNELYMCFTRDRKRFFNELDRMTDYQYRFLIIGSTYTDLLNPFCYRTEAVKNSSMTDINMKRRAVGITTSSIDGVMLSYGIHVIFAGKKIRAVTRNLLKKVFDYYKREKI